MISRQIRDVGGLVAVLEDYGLSSDEAREAVEDYLSDDGPCRAG